MGFDLKRREGETLVISHSLLPAPSDGPRYVRTYLFNQEHAPLTPPFVDLVSTGTGNYLDESIKFPAGVTKVYARSEVFLDSAFTQIDEFYPGDTDLYELLDETLLQNINTSVNELETGAGAGTVIVGEVIEGEVLEGIIQDC